MVMAIRMRLAVWLCALLNAAIVRASFWTVTSNYEYQLVLSTYSIFSTPDSYTYTSTRTISKGVTPTSAAVSTTTYSYSYQDLKIVSVFYPPGAVEESDLLPTGTDAETSSTGFTIFLMPVTYTAPATCTSSFTWATEEVVLPPSEVIDQITPSTVVTDAPYTYATYTAMGYETWYLTPEAVPFTTSEEYYYSRYIAHCSKPSSSGDYNPPSSGTDYTVCSWYGGCTSLKIWVIVIASILPALFVFGFLESWFWFRRLMLGRGALRFGTVCWIMISLWVVCFTRTQSARSKDDQKLLREKWNQMSGWTAFKLWWKWGFRHRYPEELLGQYSRNTVGIVPPGVPMPAPGQIVYGPPMVQQQGQVVMPPPAYMNQNGISMAPQPGQPMYYEAGKRLSTVTEMQAPGQAQSPPPQIPSPPIPEPSVSPPIPPGHYPTQGPSPVQGLYPTQGPPPSEMSQSPPPSEMPLAPQSPPPSEMPHPAQSPPPQSPPPPQGPPPAQQ